MRLVRIFDNGPFDPPSTCSGPVPRSGSKPRRAAIVAARGTDRAAPAQSAAREPCGGTAHVPDRVATAAGPSTPPCVRHAVFASAHMRGTEAPVAPTLSSWLYCILHRWFVEPCVETIIQCVSRFLRLQKPGPG